MPFECEICKTPYTDSFLHGGQKYKLIDIERPQSKNFAIFKSLNQEKGTERTVHVIIPADSKRIFKLGRGHEADIRITDISVSRIHASLKFIGEEIFIEDNTSKFGTLMMMPKVVVGEGMYQSIQIGRTVINLQIKINR